MIWKNQSDHITDCYFCLTDVLGFNTKNKNKIIYPDVQSANRPNKSVPYNKESTFNTTQDIEVTTCNDIICDDSDEDDEYIEDDMDYNEPHLINQDELNDLVRDLSLTQEKGELLASRLKQWNLLQKDVAVTSYRKRHKKYNAYFQETNGLCYCNSV